MYTVNVEKIPNQKIDKPCKINKNTCSGLKNMSNQEYHFASQIYK